jgi:hypothetical protein
MKTVLTGITLGIVFSIALVSNANRGDTQTFECKSCGLVATAEAMSGSMRPLIEKRHSY